MQTGESTGAQVRGQAVPFKRILLVDDDVNVLQVNAEVLSLFGYQTEAVEDGAVAWRTLQANRYDLLITDNDMPNISGVELVKKLRLARMTLPVVLVSEEIPTAELDRTLQLAATLLKPFSTDDLLRTVQQVLRASEGAYRRSRIAFATMKRAAGKIEPLRPGASMNAPTTFGSTVT